MGCLATGWRGGRLVFHTTTGVGGQTGGGSNEGGRIAQGTRAEEGWTLGENRKKLILVIQLSGGVGLRKCGSG